jgi:hypothetical protein
MKNLNCLAVSLLLLRAGLTAKAGLQHSDTKESLRGLNGVYVAVQIVDMQVPGLATNDVEKLVKSALAGAGIPANTAPEKSNGNANLSVTVAAIKQSQLNAYLFTVEVAVTQDVQLARQPQAGSMAAETWRRTVQGITTPERTDVIAQAIQQGVTAFAADFHAVNPRTAH